MKSKTPRLTQKIAAPSVLAPQTICGRIISGTPAYYPQADDVFLHRILPERLPLGPRALPGGAQPVTGNKAQMTSSRLIHSYRYQTGKWKTVDAEIIVETPVALTINGTAWLTFMCTPVALEALTVGFLYNEGVISNREEVSDVHVCEHGDNVDVWLTHEAEQPKHWRRTSGCTGGITAADLMPAMPPIGNDFTLTADTVTRLIGQLLEAQDLYKSAGGVHTSALSDGEKIIISAEDIGRPNTLDRIAGRCLLENIWPEHRILLTTGRISSEMLQKAARLCAAAVISRTAPSSLSIEMAERHGITLIGYARQRQFNVYSHPQGVAVVKRQSPSAH
jgi:FdhD protein